MPAEETQRLAPQYADDPQFQYALNRAVSERVESLLPELLSKLAAAQTGQGVLAGSSDKPVDFVSALALQLAELTGQGTGRVYVAPEIVESRRKALGKMQTLVLDLWAKSNGGRNSEYVPAYKLTSKVYLNLGGNLGEVLIEPMYRDNMKLVQATEIDWPGIPNMAMQPINEPAGMVHKLFVEWTGFTGKSSEPDELQALNSHGAVVRGKAASVILRGGRQGGMETTADQDIADGVVPAAAIRRHDRPPTTKVQVLGTLTKPVEVS